ncbi:MAG: YciI family protein [Opitutaceae bacterium]
MKPTMNQYLVSIHHPDDYNPEIAEDEAMHRAIDELNDEMVAAGVRLFVGGLHPARTAKSLQSQPNGDVRVTDGPYLQTNEHVGGFWVLAAANIDEALAWGRKAAIACRAPVEVRQFH